MIDVAGIFKSRTAAERATEHLRSIGITGEHLALLAPGTQEDKVEEAVKAAETEHTSEKIGSAVGRGLGIAGGIMIGGAVGSYFVPGVGAVLAAGILGAALLGTGGASLGAAAGGALDEAIATGLPHDDLHIYEEALRQGRVVVVAVAKDEEQAEAARKQLTQEGAESIEALRESWWDGLRTIEEEAYAKRGRDFAVDELLYRRGFEAALHPTFRGKAFAAVDDYLRERYGDDYQQEAFRLGYERGQAYHEGLVKKFYFEDERPN
ncbi:MAG TPA: hypothetical protein VF791_08875 [Pyrinomonadaceae bacterium]